MYRVQQLGVQRVMVYSSDTGIIVILLRHAYTLLDGIEIWIRKSTHQWVAVHELAKLLGPQDCALQPFLYSFTGIDDSNYIYGISKAKALKFHHVVNCEPLAM